MAMPLSGVSRLTGPPTNLRSQHLPAAGSQPGPFHSPWAPGPSALRAALAASPPDEPSGNPG